MICIKQMNSGATAVVILAVLLHCAPLEARQTLAPNAEGYQMIDSAERYGPSYDKFIDISNTGITAIIDAKGRILTRAPQFEIAVATATVQPRTGMTLYAATGNWLIVTLMALLLGIAWRLGAVKE